MRRLALAAAAIVALGLVAGCAPLGGVGDAPTPTKTVSAEAAAAQQQAQAWLDAAALPPGAVSVQEAPVVFNSYYGWPCKPVAQINGYWTIPDVGVAETANWLTQHPTDGLVVPHERLYSDDPRLTEVSVGQVPEPEAQEGLVFTIADTSVGVGIRVAAAAQYASATCPEGEIGGVGEG